MPAKTVRRDDVERFMHDIAAGRTATREKTKARGLSIVRGGRGVAGRTVALLGAIFSYAVRQGIRIDNPVHGVVRFAEGRRQRRLIDDEYRQAWQGAVDGVTGEYLEAGHRRHVADNPDRMASRRSSGVAMVGDRSAATNCATGRHQDWRIAPALVGTRPAA